MSNHPQQNRRLFSGAPLITLICTIGLLLASCAPASQPGVAPSNGASPDQGPAVALKTLRIGMIAGGEPKAGIALFGETGTGPPEFTFTYHAGLTVFDPQGSLLPRIAQKVPTIEDGDWQTFPDGRMEVTWKLRADVRWHDGTSLTADDFVFGLEILQDAQVPAEPGPGAKLVSQAVARDAQTLVVSWKQPYILANSSGPTDLPAVPRHLLTNLYQAGDKQAFVNSPYWTREFVGLGPYRLGPWESGSYMEALAFDQYFLGPPKIGRIVVRFVGDGNALVASLLSGDVDMTPMGSLKLSNLVTVKNAWEPTGLGTALPVFSGTRSVRFQFRDPSLPWAQDVRVRAAMLHALDRQGIAEALQFGLTSPADAMISAEDPVYRLLEQRGLSRYPYDLARAERLLNEAGWTRGPDGTYRSSGGQPFSVEVRSTDKVDNVQEGQAVAAQWKAAGLNATSYAFPDNSADKAELRSVFPGVVTYQLTYVNDGLGHLTTANISSARTRWNGSNYGGYSDPLFDRLSEQYRSTLDLVTRQGLLADLLKMDADKVLTIHLYYSVGTNTTAFRKGIRGPGSVPAGQLVNAWNVDSWEMD